MDYYIKLAKKAIENYIIKGEIISPPLDLPKEMLKRKSGVFVTLKKNEKLRGCIGTFLPTKKNLAEEIISNAVSSAVNDYRFLPVQKEEIPFLSYEVSILHLPELVVKITNEKEINEDFLKKIGLNPKKYGIIVKSNGKIGLLLPDIEGVESCLEQFLIACRKAGINNQDKEIEIYKFKVEKHEE